MTKVGLNGAGVVRTRAAALAYAGFGCRRDEVVPVLLRQDWHLKTGDKVINVIAAPAITNGGIRTAGQAGRDGPWAHGFLSP